MTKPINKSPKGNDTEPFAVGKKYRSENDSVPDIIDYDPLNPALDYPPPYHIFEVLGDYFMFDTTSGRYFQIEKPIYSFLKLCLDLPVAEAIRKFQSDGQYPEETSSNISSIASQLSEAGMFRSCKRVFSEEQLKWEIEQVLDHPISGIELMLAEACNLACKYCFCGKNNECRNKLMSRTTAQKAIDLLFENAEDSKRLRINLFGGEPLLNKPVLKFAVQYAEEKAHTAGKEITFSMTTNAVLLDSEILSFLEEHNLGIMVSLDGPKEIHDTQCITRSGAGSYDIVIDNIRNAVKTLSQVEVRCTMTHPLPDMKRLLNFFAPMGFSRIVMEPAINNPENTTEVDCREEDILQMLDAERNELPRILDAMFGNTRPCGFNYDRELSMISRGISPEQPCSIRCYAGCNSVCIDTEGNVYPCSKFVGSTGWIRGNLEAGMDREGLLSIWERFSRFLSQACRSCWAYPSCFKLCISEYTQSNGSFAIANPLRCLRQKAALENAIYLYTKYQSRKNM